MKLHEKSILIPKATQSNSLIEYFQDNIPKYLESTDVPVRFVIAHTEESSYHCELGILSHGEGSCHIPNDFIFKFRKRQSENINQFNAVLIIPTGIDAEIGGDSGDGGPVAKLLCGICDYLITHPNVVNASDINELPANGLYVEGSVITRLLMGTVGLRRVRKNRVLVVLDKHSDTFFYEEAINSVSAARATMGLECPRILLMQDKVSMKALYSESGRAIGVIDNLQNIVDELENNQHDYDAIALSSVIEVPPQIHRDYYRKDLINPWGGVEAMLTHAISSLLNVPSAHSPMMESRELLDINVGVVDPTKAAEAVSTTYFHSVLKGLHNSPRIVSDPTGLDPNIITASDISCLIIPYGCIGLPVLAAMEQSIPVIAVLENKNYMKNKLEEYPFKPGKLIIVNNYLEAAGVMSAIKAGVALDSLKRPLGFTEVITVISESGKSQQVKEADNSDSRQSVKEIEHP